MEEKEELEHEIELLKDEIEYQQKNISDLKFSTNLQGIAIILLAGSRLILALLQ